MDKARDLTKENTGLTFTIAFNYGGRAELVDAVKAIIRSGIEETKVNENRISKYLYDQEMPEPDLILRTSGEKRLSNFLLWQSAYSELLFLEDLWPDFTRKTFHQAVKEYQNRSRRFGEL